MRRSGPADLAGVRKPSKRIPFPIDFKPTLSAASDNGDLAFE